MHRRHSNAAGTSNASQQRLRKSSITTAVSVDQIVKSACNCFNVTKITRPRQVTCVLGASRGIQYLVAITSALRGCKNNSAKGSETET